MDEFILSDMIDASGYRGETNDSTKEFMSKHLNFDKAKELCSFAKEYFNIIENAMELKKTNEKFNDTTDIVDEVKKVGNAYFVESSRKEKLEYDRRQNMGQYTEEKEKEAAEGNLKNTYLHTQELERLENSLAEKTIIIRELKEKFFKVDDLSRELDNSYQNMYDIAEANEEKVPVVFDEDMKGIREEYIKNNVSKIEDKHLRNVYEKAYFYLLERELNLFGKIYKDCMDCESIKDLMTNPDVIQNYTAYKTLKTCSDALLSKPRFTNGDKRDAKDLEKDLACCIDIFDYIDQSDLMEEDKGLTKLRNKYEKYSTTKGKDTMLGRTYRQLYDGYNNGYDIQRIYDDSNTDSYSMNREEQKEVEVLDIKERNMAQMMSELDESNTLENNNNKNKNM